MNSWDQENLRFLMQASEAQLGKWREQLTADDMAYASELLQQAADALKSDQWRTIADMIVAPEDYSMDVSQAAALLKQFQL